MNVFDPMQSMNALAGGMELGGHIRSKQTQNALAPMVAKGDYKGAMDYAGSRGDLGMVNDMRTQYEAQVANLDEQSKAAERKRIEGLARIAYGGRQYNDEALNDYVRSKAPELTQLGMTQEQVADLVHNGVTRKGLEEFITALTPIEEFWKKPDPYTLSEGQVRFGGNNEQVAAGAPKPPPEPGQAADSLGVRKYTSGPNVGQPVQGFETPRPRSGGMEVGVDENGRPVIKFGGSGGGSGFGKPGDTVGSKAFGDALESASTADATLSLANQARSIIDGGFNSGALAGIKGEVGRIGAEFGLADEDKVADYEQFTAVNNQLAAQMLKLFGGSDTERELAISMASNIGPSFSEAANKRMLDALEKTVAIQRQKPEYIAQWMKTHPSLDAIDPQSGLGFQATWDRYLQQQSGLYVGAANAAQPEMAGRAAGGLPASEIEALSDDDILSQLGLN